MQQSCAIKNTDMSQDMQKEVIEYSRRAIDQGKTIKIIASMNVKIIIMELGIVQWVETLDHLQLMNLNIIFIFILDKLPFYFLKPVDYYYLNQWEILNPQKSHNKMKLNYMIFLISNLTLENFIKKKINSSFISINKNKKNFNILLILIFFSLKEYKNYILKNETTVQRITCEYSDYNLLQDIYNRKSLKKYFQDYELFYIIDQVVDTLLFMKSKNTFHGNIQPSQIYFNEFYNVKIGDFRYIREFQFISDEIVKYGLRPQTMVSPEQLMRAHQKKYDFINFGQEEDFYLEVFLFNKQEQSQIFQLGLTILCCIKRKDDLKLYEIQDLKIKGYRIQQLLQEIQNNKPLYNLLQQMLVFLPENRITLESLKSQLEEIKKDKQFFFISAKINTNLELKNNLNKENDNLQDQKNKSSFSKLDVNQDQKNQNQIQIQDQEKDFKSKFTQFFQQDYENNKQNQDQKNKSSFTQFFQQNQIQDQKNQNQIQDQEKDFKSKFTQFFQQNVNQDNDKQNQDQKNQIQDQKNKSSFSKQEVIQNQNIKSQFKSFFSRDQNANNDFQSQLNQNVKSQYIDQQQYQTHLDNQDQEYNKYLESLNNNEQIKKSNYQTQNNQQIQYNKEQQDQNLKQLQQDQIFDQNKNTKGFLVDQKNSNNLLNQQENQQENINYNIDIYKNIQSDQQMKYTKLDNDLTSTLQGLAKQANLNTIDLHLNQKKIDDKFQQINEDIKRAQRLTQNSFLQQRLQKRKKL